MSEQLNHLRDLQAQLHEVNQEWAEASRPLDRLSEMSLEERDHAAARLREAQARWVAVTRQINQLLQTPAQAVGERAGAADVPQ